MGDFEAVAGQGVSRKSRPAGTSDHRKHVRHPLHWRVAIVHKNGDKNDIYHGRTQDLSARGASVYVDHNIFTMKEVVVLLGVPPLHAGQKETIIEIQSSMVYTVFDSGQSQFRIGIRFSHFKGDGKKILEGILSKRLIPKSEPRHWVE